MSESLCIRNKENMPTMFNEWWAKEVCCTGGDCSYCKTDFSCNGTEKLCRKAWETATYVAEHKGTQNEGKAVCIRCRHHISVYNEDACNMEEPDYVCGGIRKVYALCRSKNTDGNCKDYNG